MPTIYDINFSQLGRNLLPPNKRNTKMVAWITVLLYPLQYLRDLVLGDYAYGAVYPYWQALTLYNVGTRRLFSDNAAYECTVAHTSTSSFDITKWTKIQDFKAGVFERINYNDKKITLEAVLNKWFDYYKIPGSPIYIDRVTTPVAKFYVSNTENYSSTVTNIVSKQQYFVSDYDYSTDSWTSFIVYVKAAQFNALASNNPDREKIVRSVVDRFNSAGFLYEVATY